MAEPPLRELCRRQNRTIVVLTLVLLAVFGWLIVSRIALFYATNEVANYRGLWMGEVEKRRHENTGPRMAIIERRTAEIGAVVKRQPPEIRNDVKKRLAGIRLYFAGGVPSQALKCPTPAKQPPAPVATPGPDAPAAEPGVSAKHRATDRANIKRLSDLQAWVKRHELAYHGVTL